MNSRTKLQSRRGFTLIEMMIVIAIIAIMSAIAIPFFGGFVENRDLKSAARDIAGDIFELKERAMAEDRLYQISFDQGANSYKLTQCNDTALPCSGNDLATKSPSAFKNGITMTAVPAGNTIQFQPRGTVTAGIGTVTLRNLRGSTASITISVTGRTSVDWTGTLR